MTLSVEAQRFDQAKDFRLYVFLLNIQRFAHLEMLTSYHPLRGRGTSSAAVVCGQKARFYTRRDAERVRDKIERKDGDALEVYGCTCCGHFHLTSARKKARR
jgi:glutamine phosphoribosylpyrophosphate amidotransferase